MHRKLILIFMTVISAFSGNSQMADSFSKEEGLIAFASDTQAPMWVETILLRPNKNRTATKLLFSDVLNRKPSSLFILGDVVNLGYSNRQWKPIDNYLTELRNNEIGVHAILGNHEVMGRAREGERKFQVRFPNHIRTGYIEVIDSVAVVLLNSNFNTLSKQEDADQVAWYRQTLDSLDKDQSVQFIITSCHHSPFTNSKVVGPSVPVQQKFVPAFLASPKSQLFLSGHCHAFEHFRVKGKDFMVIGGGGGLNQPLKTGIGTLADLAESYKPLFHYITIRRSGEQLQLTSHHINKDFSGFEEGMKMDISRNANAAFAHLNQIKTNEF